MTPTNKAILFTAALAASASASATPPHSDCIPGQTCSPGGTTTTVTGTAAPTATAAPIADAAAQAAAQAAAEAAAIAAAQAAANAAAIAAQNLKATQKQSIDGKQTIDGQQDLRAEQKVGDVKATAKTTSGDVKTMVKTQTAAGDIRVEGDNSYYKAAKIPVASANPGTAYAEGICGHAASGAVQGTLLGAAFNFSGKEQHCRNYFMLLANNQPEAATVYGMQNIPGMAKAINGAADVEEEVAAKPELAETRYVKFRSIRVNPLLNQQ